VTKSFADKLAEAEQLAVRLAYNGDMEVANTSLYGEEVDALIWSYVDGLRRKYIMDRIEGRCSLADMLAFDMEQEEALVEQDIRVLRELLSTQTT
jgi:vacuolar-type H+-ATPase subunit I/STV1